MNNKFDSRQTELRAALAMVGSAASDTLDAVFPLIDAEIAKLFEDRNTILAGGGVLFVSAPGTSLSMTSALNLHINSLIAGGAPKIIGLTSATRTFTNDGNMLYVIVDRVAGTGTVVADAATLPAVTSVNQEIVLIAKRIGTSIVFRNGLVIPAGRSTQIQGQSSEYLQPSVVNDGATTGANATAAAFTAGIIRLTANTLLSLSGIPAGQSGQIVIIENQTGNAITINDDEVSAASVNRIRTGTAGNVQMLNNATFIFTYDATNSRWMLTGGSGSGSGSGGINYIKNPSAEAGLQDTALYADAAGVGPVDGTGGVPFVTLVRSTVAPLTGLASYIFSKDAVNRQGQGMSMDFVIDAGYQGQQMAINYLYQIMGGTFATGDMSVWIVDTTNNLVIQPSASSVVNSATAQPAQPAVFQTSINSVNYRLCFHVSSTSALAYSIKLDGVSVGPQISTVGQTGILGQIISTGSTTPPANHLYCNGTAVSRLAYPELFNLVGTRYGAGDGSTTFNLPDLRGRFLRGTSDGTGRDPDAGSRTAMNAGGLGGDTPGSIQGDEFRIHNHRTDGADGGNQHAARAGVDAQFDFFSATSDPNDLTYIAGSVTGTRGGNETRPLNANVAYHICFRSGVLMSTDASSRAVAASANKSSAQSIPDAIATPITNYTGVQGDSHGAFDSVTGIYTVKVPGWYRITGAVGWTRNATGARASVLIRNGSTFATAETQGSGVSITNPLVSKELQLLVNDTIQLAGYQASGGALNTDIDSNTTNFSIEMIQGPAQIQAATIVGARYRNTAGTSMPGGVQTPVPFANKDEDTVNGWNGTQYVVQSSGLYDISVTLNVINGGYNPGDFWRATILINGVAASHSVIATAQQSFGSVTIGASAHHLARLKIGDTISFAWFHNPSVPTSPTLNTTDGYNHFQISRQNGVN